jgi:hypothetical protein
MVSIHKRIVIQALEHLPDFESHMNAEAYVREQAALTGVKTD